MSFQSFFRDFFEILQTFIIKMKMPALLEGEEQ